MSITVDGIDYALVDGNYDLGSLFKRNIVDAGQISEEVFNANVVAYHTDDKFKSFVQSAFDDGGENNAQLLLVAFGGPSAILDFIRSAKEHGIKGARRGTKRNTRAWQSQMIEALSAVGHKAMQEYFADNKDELFQKCGVPNESRQDSYEDMLVATGRGTLSYKVSMWEGVGASDDHGKFAISLAYRLDANNKGRAKRKTTNGVAESAQPSAK